MWGLKPPPAPPSARSLLYITRQSTQLNLFQCQISAAERAFRFRASNWNNLSNETRNSASFDSSLDYSRCQCNLDSGFESLVGFRIPWAPESKAQDSRFHKQNFPGFRNPDSLAWGKLWVYAATLVAAAALLRGQSDTAILRAQLNKQDIIPVFLPENNEGCLV